MQNEKIHWADANEITAVICGLDPETDHGEVEQVLFDKFEISTEAFEKILQIIYDMIDFGVSPITNTPTIGFALKGEKVSQWILKKDCTQEFISGAISYICEGESLDKAEKGWQRTISVNNEPKYDLVVKHHVNEDKEEVKSN